MDNKILDNRNTIINRGCEVYKFSLDQEVDLKRELSKLHKEMLLDKYSMQYVYDIQGNEIVLVIYKSMDEYVLSPL